MTRARFASGTKIRVTKAPKEAPYLLGKLGEIIYPARVKNGLCCILIDGKFTHLKESHLERVSALKPPQATSL